MTKEPQLRAVVSGSFHRHMGLITSAVHELAALSVRVLSPADPRVVAAQGEFLFVASDPVRSVRLVQDRHLDCIRAADFLWLVCPDGYVGQSASMEIGYAAGAGVPIFATATPQDLTLREYVRVVPSLSEAMRQVLSNVRPRATEGILVNPKATIERAQEALVRIEAALTTEIVGSPASAVYRDIADLRVQLQLPTLLQ